MTFDILVFLVGTVSASALSEDTQHILTLNVYEFICYKFS